jgi:hypothetical protein
VAIKKNREEDLDYEDEIEVFHVLPAEDYCGHVASKGCWCNPILNYKNPETGNEVWSHNLIQ